MNKIIISGLAQRGAFYLTYKDLDNSEITRTFRLEDTESSPVWCSVDTKFSNGTREHFSEEMPFPRRNPILPRVLYLQPLEYLAAREYAETIVKTNPGKFEIDDEIEKRFRYEIRKSLTTHLVGRKINLQSQSLCKGASQEDLAIGYIYDGKGPTLSQ